MENNKKNKIFQFVKKYGYYAFAGLLIVGITFAIIFANVPNKKVDDNIVPDVPSSGGAIVFTLPVENPTLIKGYSETELFYNETLNQWESHKAVDLKSDNLNVYAVLDGKVSKVVNNFEHGTTITITHENGFVSVYSSLDKDIKVAEDDIVKKGQQIGTMSTSSANEEKQGSHLHFELFKDGEKVDPANYLTFENK